MTLMHLDKILFVISHLVALILGFGFGTRLMVYTLRHSPPCPACGGVMIPWRGRLTCTRCKASLGPKGGSSHGSEQDGQ